MRLNKELYNEFVTIHREFCFVKNQMNFLKQKIDSNFHSSNTELIERFNGYKVRLEYMMSKTDVKERINGNLQE